MNTVNDLFVPRLEQVRDRVEMRKLSIALMLVAILLVVMISPVLAAPPEGTAEYTVEPVIGGPDNPVIKTTPATVTIPVNNPVIRSDADIAPGEVFVPTVPF